MTTRDQIQSETKDDLSWIKETLMTEGYLTKRKYTDIVSIETGQLSNTNNNVGSILRKITVKFETSSGELRTESMVLKSKRLETGPQDVSELLGAFPLEIKMYGEVLRNINELLDKRNANKPWPEYYGSKDSNILLEDLSVSGFTIKSDRKMDTDHAKISIKELGRYHAMTMVIVEQGLVDPSWFKPSAYARHLEFMLDLNMSAFNGLVNSMRLHWGEEWSETADKVVKLTQNLGDSLEHLWHMTKGNCQVINHGEYWLNNLIFKYDKNGKVNDMRILDFQMSHYNSPAWDLAIFLYGSIMPNLRLNIKDSLIEIYHDALTSTLKSFDYKGEIPSKSHLMETLDRIWLFCFLASVTAPPWMLAMAKEGVHHEDDTAGKELLKSFHMPCYQWQAVRDTMKEEVQYWQKNGKI